MSSILKNANISETGKEKPVYTNITCVETDTPEIFSGFGINKQYKLEARVGVLFWANRATYDTALHAAEIGLLQGLHAEQLGCIALLRMALVNYDREGALDILSDLQKSMGL